LRREARDLRAGDDARDVGGTGGAALCGQCEPYFKWLKDPRFAPEAEVLELEATFLPVEIEAGVAREPVPMDAPMPPPFAPLSARRVDITLSDGRRILVEGPTALAAVVSLVQGLSV